MMPRSRAPRSRTSKKRPYMTVAIAAVIVTAAAASFHVSEQRQFNRLFTEANVHLEAQRLKPALSALRNALGIDPDHHEANFLMADVLVRLGHGERAKAILRRLESVGFEHPEMEMLGVQALLVQRSFDEAVQAIERRPAARDDPEILALLGEAQLGAGRFDDAFSAYSELLDVVPGSVVAHRGMAQVAIAEGEVEEAEAELDHALSLNENELPTWLLKGELELVLQRFDPALDSFQRALDISPNDPNALRGIAQTMLALERPQDARAYIESMLQKFPKDPVAHYLGARLARTTGDLDTAKEALERALKLAPGHASSMLLRAHIHYEEGQLGLAGATPVRLRHAVSRRYRGAKAAGGDSHRIGRTDEGARGSLGLRESISR